MLSQLLAIDEVFHFAIGYLSYQSVPARFAATAGIEYVVLFPVRLRTESFPGSDKQRRSVEAPTPIGQIFEIQLAVIRIHRRFQRANRVEALYELVPTGPVNRQINKSNASRVSTVEVFALVANLSLLRIRPSPIGRGHHPYQTITAVF